MQLCHQDFICGWFTSSAAYMLHSVRSEPSMHFSPEYPDGHLASVDCLSLDPSCVCIYMTTIHWDLLPQNHMLCNTYRSSLCSHAMSMLLFYLLTHVLYIYCKYCIHYPIIFHVFHLWNFRMLIQQLLLWLFIQVCFLYYLQHIAVKLKVKCSSSPVNIHSVL